MTLDHWLVARLAKELRALVAGARIDALTASESSIIFFCYRRGKRLALHISVDSSAPLAAAYELGEAAKENGPLGWAGGVGALVRGATIDAVHAVPNDRILMFDLSSRSAFGVPARTRIVAELQPRKANALILREGTSQAWLVVAAAKQFAGQGRARVIKTGQPYLAPPPRRAVIDRVQFKIAVADAQADGAALARLLAEVDADCTPALAKEVVSRVAAAAGTVNAQALLDGWAQLRRELEDAIEESHAVFVVERNGTPLSCHLVPPLDAKASTTAPTINEVCVMLLRASPAQRQAPSRDAMRKKLQGLLERCDGEMRSLEAAQMRGAQADELRAAGDAIYAHLHEIAPGSDSFTTSEGRLVALDPHRSPKENAAELFRRYKKARSGLPRIAVRLRTLRANREYWEQLAWELDRTDEAPAADGATALLEEIAQAVGVKQTAARSRRKPMQAERSISLTGGVVALVGRSPKDNERLTFSVASPDDLWMHARGIPGAHVVVRSAGQELSKAQIEEAASLAAGHSKAAGAASVEVDYTARKHVRRRGGGRPGQVFYTDFKTVRVRPRHG